MAEGLETMPEGVRAELRGGRGSVITWCIYGPGEGSAATFATFLGQLGPTAKANPSGLAGDIRGE